MSDKLNFEASKLDFTPTRIAELEDRRDKMLMLIVADFRVGVVLDLIKAGTGCDDKGANDRLNDYLATGKDVTTLHAEILEVLEKQGFLSKDLKMASMVKANLERMKEKSSEIAG